MRKLLFIPLLLLAAVCQSQVIADPATSQEILTNLSDTNINPLLVPLNGTIKLKIPIYNRSLVNPLPPGACKIKIGLGSKIAPVSGLDFNNVLAGNYFLWTKEFNGGQFQLTGELVLALPANYSDTAIFNVEGNVLGNSTVTTNFLITNHNTAIILSDENPNNNSSFLPYTVVQTTPVNFTGLALTKSGCAIGVNFSAENEINVRKYEIESSRDGIHFAKAGEIAAASLIRYKASLPLTSMMASGNIFIRVKSVDLDGRYQYSETKSISGACEQALLLELFPNPVSGINQPVIIHAKEGRFNGSYFCNITDATGKLIYRKAFTNLTGIQQVALEPANLTAGKYFVQVVKADGRQSFVLQFQQL